MEYIRFFESEPSVTAFFTTRKGGTSPAPYNSLNLGPFTEDHPDNVAENRKKLLEGLGLTSCRIAGLQQVHGNQVRRVTADDAAKIPEGEYLCLGEADALITKELNLVLTTLHADCLGILFYDPENHAIGAAHAGWRGTLAGIAGETVRAMMKAYGTRLENLRAALTPCIDFCCFETGPEVLDLFAEKFAYAPDFARKKGNGKYLMDLKGLNRRQLQDLGIRNPETAPHCTGCREELFFSYRRDGGKTGRMAAGICLHK